MKREHHFFLKGLILAIWAVCIVGLFVVAHLYGIHLRQVPSLVEDEVKEAGLLGPPLIMALYAASTVLFFPKGGLDILAGALYGPLLGSVTVIIGVNVAGAIIFWFGRFFGHHFIQVHAKGWVKKYNDLLKEEGFMTVLLMRLLLLPFDITSIVAGMSDVSFRQYFWGTFLGTLPSTITLVVLGQSLQHPRSWALFLVLLAASFGLALWVRSLPGVKKRLYKD